MSSTINVFQSKRGSSSSSSAGTRHRAHRSRSPLTLFRHPSSPATNPRASVEEEEDLDLRPEGHTSSNQTFFLSNADANSNFSHVHRFHFNRHIFSSESIIMEPSYETVGRRRHLMESRRALNIPPVSTFICVIHLLLYLYREKLFNVKREEDVYVSWELVWNKGQYWRLFTTQFFHFNRLNVIVNSFTLFTVGRYLERKIAMSAMLIVILVMSALTHFIHILVIPISWMWFCRPPREEFVPCGFGNVIYSLRVFLAYALEPRNYEKDLVYGLYPMVVSASHAPWQPLLDMIIYKFVLPEQCITGQLSGIAAGFLVSWVLLLWPTRGVYIARPPFYWTFMGTRDPGDRRDEDQDQGPGEGNWRMNRYTNSEFWLPSSSNGMAPSSENPSDTSTNVVDIDVAPGMRPRPINSMEERSQELKEALGSFIFSPSLSLVRLVRSFATTEEEREEEQRRKEFREKWAERKRRYNPVKGVRSERGNARVEVETPRKRRSRPVPPQMEGCHSVSSTSSGSGSEAESSSSMEERPAPTTAVQRTAARTGRPRPPPPRRNEMLSKRALRQQIRLAMAGCGDEQNVQLNRATQ